MKKGWSRREFVQVVGLSSLSSAGLCSSLLRGLGAACVRGVARRPTDGRRNGQDATDQLMHVTYLTVMKGDSSRSVYTPGTV